MQGYLFAKPTFESLPEITWPDAHGQRSGLSLNLGRPSGLSSVA
jgi:hypothetical protein